MPAAACLWVVALVASLSLMGDDIVARLVSIVAASVSAGSMVYASRPIAIARGVIVPALIVSALWVAASVLWSGAAAITIMMAPTFIIFAILTVAVTLLRADDLVRFMRWAAWGGFGVVVGLCVWAIVQYYVLPHWLVAAQVRHPFANPNAYASFLNCAIFAALAVVFLAEQAGHKPRYKTMVAWGLIALVLFAQSTISSRGGLFVLIGGLIVLTFLEPSFIRTHLKQWAGCLLAGIGGVFCTQFFANDGQQTMISRMANIAEHPDNFILGRTALWDGAFDLVAAYPILGTGYGTFFLHYPAVRTMVDEWSGGFMVHNDFLQILAETGIVGAILLGVILVAAVVVMIKSRRDNILNIRARGVAAILFCGIGAVVAHAIFDFPFYTLPIMLVLPLMMGAWLAQVQSMTITRHTNVCGHRYVDVILVVGLIAGLGVWAQIMLSERSLIHAEYLFQRDDVNGFSAHVNDAHRLGMGLNDKAYAFAARIPMGILAGDGRRIPMEDRQKLIAQANDLLDAAMRHNPYRASYYMQRAELSVFAGDLWPDWMADTQSLLRQALMVDPRFIPARMRLATVLVQSGADDAAYDVLRDGLGWVYLDRMGDAVSYYDRVLAMADARGDMDAPDMVAAIDQRDRLKGALRKQRESARGTAMPEQARQ